MVWYGLVWFGMVWYGLVWFGMVRYGLVWFGMTPPLPPNPPPHPINVIKYFYVIFGLPMEKA